jgi:uncharacterized membrane protein YeaQ/YmgE (transglycosylase-associated protein family)
MTLVDLVVLLVIAGVCGSIGQAIVGYSHAGCLGSIAVGFVGALLGTWIARAFRFPEILTIHVGTQAYPVVWSVIGAALFVGAISLLSGNRWRYHTL